MSTSSTTAERDIEKARDGAYDMMVLDIMLPSMNGYKVCRALREDEVWTPILMLTAKDGEYDEAEALDTGADDFLSKPFSFVVLVARLRALARRRTDHNLQPLEARRPGPRRRGPHVSPRRHRDLAVAPRVRPPRGAAAPPEEIVSKQELLERVWGEDFQGDPNVVEVYVGYLRRKIDRPFGRTDLETIRGEGYRIWVPTEPGRLLNPSVPQLLGSVRVRLTGAVAIIFGVALSIAAFGLVREVQAALINDVQVRNDAVSQALGSSCGGRRVTGVPVEERDDRHQRAGATGRTQHDPGRHHRELHLRATGAVSAVSDQRQLPRPPEADVTGRPRRCSASPCRRR